ncbi:MAG: ROK family protein [Bacteroidota bacterium]
MNGSHLIVMGIDIGGSHITAGLVNMEKRGVLEGSIIRKRVNSHAAAEDILDAWAECIMELRLKTEIPIFKIGIAMPGPFDYENGVSLIKGFDKYELLYGTNIREALALRLGIPGGNILFRNDAEAFLEGELFCGAAAGFDHAIGITLGTGLGSAVSHLGETRDAALSVMEYKGTKIEEFVSTRGLIDIYHSISGVIITDVRYLAQLAATDAGACEAFLVFAKHLAWFLQQFIAQESPQVLVIGGNIANASDLFMPEVERVLSIEGVELPKILMAMLGEDAAIIGAACCFQKQAAPIGK